MPEQQAYKTTHSCTSQSHTCTCIHTSIRAGRKVQMLESSFVCCAFEAEFLLLKLSCHAHFNVCTYTPVQSKHVVNNVSVFQKR